MKTLSKVLSMLIVVVMCLSLFGASAYATDGVPTVVDQNQTQAQGAPTVDLYSFGGIDDGPDIIDNSDELGMNNKKDPTDLVPAVDPTTPTNQTDPATPDTTVPSTQDVPTTPSTEQTDGTKPIVDGDMPQRMAPGLTWNRDKVGYDSLQAAVNAVSNSNEILLSGEATLTGTCVIDSKNLTLNLGSNTLNLVGSLNVSKGTVTLNGGAVNVSGIIANVESDGTLVINSGTYDKGTFGGTGSVIINGGTFGTDPQLYPNVKINGTCEKNASGAFEVKAAAENVASITGKGSWATVKDAVANASNGDTIIINTNKQEVIPATSLTIENDITFNVGDEAVNFEGTTIQNANVTINGYEIQGKITLKNSTLNLSTKKAGTIEANGKSVSVYGTEVTEVILNGATLNMSNGTINKLTSNGSDVMNVSGGNIKTFTKGTNATANRAITGGSWGITDPGAAELFKNSLANGLTWNMNNNIYTVSGSGSNPGGSTTTPSQGGYALSTNGYTKGSNSSVYIVRGTNAPAVTSVWYGTSSDRPAARISVSYTSGNNIYLSNSSLDSMPTGTYYIFAAYNNDANASSAGTLTIYGRGTEIPSYGGSLQVGTRYENDWYQGEDALQFYVTPFPGSGKDWTNMKVSIDNREVGNLDYYDYHNGYFYISTSKLESLGSGTHWLTVENIQTGETGTCSFYVGATLKARDTNKHVTGSSKDLKFVCSEPISRVWVGDKELDNYDSYDYYTLSRDGKTLTLTARFLNNRTAGNTYNLTVETVNGDRVSTTFQILTTAQASSSPKTGDNSNLALWISALVMSGAAAAVIIPSVKRKEIEG